MTNERPPSTKDSPGGEPIGIAGHPSPLTRQVQEDLDRGGYSCVALGFSPEDYPEVCLYNPFPPGRSGLEGKRYREDLERLRKFLQHGVDDGLRHLVLRSHALAFDVHYKNYGLMHEDRPAAPNPSPLARHWLKAEELLQRFQEDSDLTTAVIRFGAILDPDEGDYLTHLLDSRVAFPWAGYDPLIQLMGKKAASRVLFRALASRKAGIYNAAGNRPISLRDALRSAVPVRIPLPGTFKKLLQTGLWRCKITSHPGPDSEQLRYNWTVSNSAAVEAFDAPRESSREALVRFLRSKGRAPSSTLENEYDRFGLDPSYLDFWSFWFFFLTRVYWRVEVEGLSHIPATGKGIFVGNHRGFMPFDGVIHRCVIKKHSRRQVRFLIIPSLVKFPFLADFMMKQGGVLANQLNSSRLLEEGNLVGIFPEGVRGTFRPYRNVYRLGSFGRHDFARIAIEHQAPIFPSATIGHAETYPIFKNFSPHRLIRWLGWPYFPITATFPFLPFPLPSKWHIRYLEPIDSTQYSPEEANDRKAVKDLSLQVRTVMQENIDDMLRRRKHIFFGKIFDESSEDDETPSHSCPRASSR